MNKILFVWLVAMLMATNLQAGESVLEIIALSHRPAKEIAPLIRPLIDGDDRITASGLQLIVRTSPARLAEIQKLVEKLDKSPHNLLITVIQGQDIELEELNASADLYAEIPINDPTRSNVEITGRYHRTKSDKSNEAVQKIRTLEGSSAFIKFGEDRPTQGYILSDTGDPIYMNRMKYVETTAGFSVIPKLIGDQVILELAPWADRSSGVDNVVITQSANTTFKTRLGEWVEIGGNTKERSSNTSGTLTKVEKTLSRSDKIFVKVEDLDAAKKPKSKKSTNSIPEISR